MQNSRRWGNMLRRISAEAEAEVFEVHSMMLDDFDDQVEEIVKEQS